MNDQGFWMFICGVLIVIASYTMGFCRGWRHGWERGYHAGETIHSLRELKYKYQGEFAERN